MEKRLVETEKITDLYKNFFNEIPELIKKYKEIIKNTKDEIIQGLEEAKENKMRN